jgi:septal ring factor EnvC (AmiA/AmiB activator)
METQNRQLYATPILWRQLKTKLAQDIADSQLLACEIETIVKELYDQIRALAEDEYQVALQQAQLAQAQEEEAQKEE